MKPLICPQCGGKITEYSPWQQFATCDYCQTKFVIEQQKPKTVEAATPVYQSLGTSSPNSNIIIGSIVGICLVIFGIFFFAIPANKKEPQPVSSRTYSTPTYPTVSPRLSPTPTPNLNLLEFGGKGTGDGLFKDADSIAVDSKGRIYVGDDSLRVQQFDAEGKFLKLWQIPSQTVNYKRARTINKIAVGSDDTLYVAVGGVILLYNQESGEPVHTIHNAPDYTQDFALRSDGGLLLISNDDQIETLFFVTKNRKVTRRIKGFHTETADASMSPYETGLAAIRIAVDGANNIYSIYALGDLGSYQLSYNPEDFMIFRFTPEGKYVNKFVQTMNSCGIEVDNQSRIYISEDKSIAVYSNSGESLASVDNLSGIDAFALDKQNNFYSIHDDRVIKRAAVQ